MSERTAPALAQLDALLPLIVAMPSSPTRTQLVDETEALKRAVSAFHMGAALKLARAVDLTRHVLAIEILAACQGLDLLAPLTSSAPLERVRRAVRAVVPTLTVDRSPSPDIARIAELIERGVLEAATGIGLS